MNVHQTAIIDYTPPEDYGALPSDLGQGGRPGPGGTGAQDVPVYAPLQQVTTPVPPQDQNGPVIVAPPAPPPPVVPYVPAPILPPPPRPVADAPVLPPAAPPVIDPGLPPAIPPMHPNAPPAAPRPDPVPLTPAPIVPLAIVPPGPARKAPSGPATDSGGTGLNVDRPGVTLEPTAAERSAPPAAAGPVATSAPSNSHLIGIGLAGLLLLLMLAFMASRKR